MGWNVAWSQHKTEKSTENHVTKSPSQFWPLKRKKYILKLRCTQTTNLKLNPQWRNQPLEFPSLEPQKLNADHVYETRTRRWSDLIMYP